MLVQSPSSNQLRSGRGHTLGKLVQPVLDDDDLRWGGGVARRCAFFDEQEALAVGGDVPVTTGVRPYPVRSNNISGISRAKVGSVSTATAIND